MSWEDVVQNVSTRFSTEGGDGAAANFAAMGNSAASFGETLNNVQNVYGRFMGVIQRVQPILMDAIQMGAQRQELELVVAGQLRAYNAVGESMDSINHRFAAGTQQWSDAVQSAFTDARAASRSTLDQITRDAAALPGEAEDYIQGLQTTLPAMMQASNTRRVSDLVAMQNRFIATSLVNQEDAPQAGRDLAEILHGRANLMTKAWTSWLGGLVHNPGRDTWQGLTLAQRHAREAADPTGTHRWVGGNNRVMQTHEFNRLTGEQRVEAVQRALQTYAPLLDQMGNTWATQMGTFNSMVTTIKRVISAPLFEPALRMLTRINDLLSKVQDNIQIIGGYFARYVGDAIGRLVPLMSDLWTRTMDGIVGFIRSPVFHNIFARVEQVGRAIYGALSPLLNSRAGVLGIGAGLFGSFGAALMSVVNNPRVMVAFNMLADTLLYLIRFITPTAEAVGRFHDQLGDLLGEAFVAFARIVDWTAHTLIEAFEVVKFIGTIFYAAFYPAIWAVRAVTRWLGMDGVLGALNLFVHFIEGVALALAFVLSPVIFAFGLIVGAVTIVVAVLTRLAAFIARTFHLNVDQSHPTQSNANTLENWLNDLTAMMSAKKTNKGGSDADRTGNARHPTTHNDFRFSRFDITQSFSPGFDPDRVAAAFVTDLQSMAEQRLESGFVPAASGG